MNTYVFLFKMENLATYYVFDCANTVLTKVNKPIRSLRDSEILVNRQYTTLCGSDLHTYYSLRNEPCPTILGHEYCS